MAAPEGLPFDPFELLGIDYDAEAADVTLAWRAEMRRTHPDVAGAAGLERAKRVNVARDWLLEPSLRAQLPRPARMRDEVLRTHPSRPPTGSVPLTRRRRRDEYYKLFEWSRSFDPFGIDFGPATEQIRAILHRIPALTPIERARLEECHLLGFARRFRPFLDDTLLERSEALEAAINKLADQGSVTARARLIMNDYAEWMLLEEFLREEITDLNIIEELRDRATRAWFAVDGQDLYGPNTSTVERFLMHALQLPREAAERMAIRWKSMYGDGWRRVGVDYMPVPSSLPYDEYRDALELNAKVAVAAAARLPLPDGLKPKHVEGAQAGLRLAAHAIALGLRNDPVLQRALAPWQSALEPPRSLVARVLQRLA